MSDLKITIDQLKNYLGTGLKFQLLYDCHEEFYEMEDSKGYQEAFTEGSIWQFMGWSELEIPMGEGEFSGELLQHDSGIYMGNYGTHKPMFFRLSDLDKFIPELGFVPCEEMFPVDTQFEKDLGIKSTDHMHSVLKYGIDGFHYGMLKKLFQWHFWPFGDEYFEKELVIDKMKYGKEATNE